MWYAHHIAIVILMVKHIYIINQWNLGYHILRQTDVIVWVVPQCCTDPGTAVNILVGG